MNCKQANQIDLVEYLNLLGYQPSKVNNHDYWYTSPLREEKEASFKVNKNKNIWYDHGLGKGGKLVDFLTQYYRCDIGKALEKISSFHPQKHLQHIALRPPFHSSENNLFNNAETREAAVKIIAAKQPIEDSSLCSYLKERRIDFDLANKYCREVKFMLNNKERTYRAIGFKNNAGGYELRNDFFKGSSSPKYISYMDNKSEKISVFEGFFDFLSFQTMYNKQEREMTNFLILNSLSFFERSLLLMEKHHSVKLYLDNDRAGRKYRSLALKRSIKFQDKSKLYKGYKDFNDWLMNPTKENKQRHFFNRHV